MLFNSLHFLVFFPTVLVLFYVLPHRFRWAMLLVASYYFYMGWNPAYASLLFLTTTVDYFIANRLQVTESASRRKQLLGLSLALNLGLLFYFKYYNFFIDNINSVSGSQLKYMEFLLPVGISFYTFQEVGYVIDVYRRNLQAERHFGKFALFVSYFPQLVAGPIERAGHLMHQLKHKVVLHYEHFSKGFQYIAWGFFKKVVIADNLAAIVNDVYSAPGEMAWYWLLLATYFFTIQIYCDFSGYSDIAIGVARTMGVNLMENFRLPYLSGSIREFWSRWHISLSTWFRDYLYIPLGGNRHGEWKTNRNLFVVFAVSGLWHGANWTFVVWGLWHGILLVVENVLRRFRVFNEYLKAPGFLARWIGIGITLHLVVLGWIFFRADSVQDAQDVLTRIFTLQDGKAPNLALKGMPIEGVVFKVLLVGAFFVADPWMHKVVRGERLTGRPLLKRLVFAAVVALTLILGFWGDVEFIYFQF